MTTTDSPIKNLPNELLSNVLAELSTKELLPVVSVSHRFCSLATRILHRRLAITATLPGNEVILECYHPSAKISTPYLACRYLGTASCDGPSINEQNPSFVHLRKMYSCFRPVIMEENRRRRFRYGWSVQTLAGSTQLQIAAEDILDETAHQEVYLDEGERFSQLCTVTNVVTHGSRPGLFTRHVNISEGVIRVFRHWLSNGATIASSGTFSSNDSRILWVDRTKDIGLRFKVTPGPETRGTIFEDEPPVFYNLIYEELIIRTSTLLLAVEEAAVKYVAHSGKDIIIASI
ncbi:f-box-like domain-containing protein [Trichoderma breve]|uniref:F-box-like domain-containing protein n=1 Tax=Trichoderma breve TaxID=2034170 RepID=A0A9W9E546_9HYPO|nr:f-box-like domain-containing protein [Trichoderma breve]KAJ4855036.1 f-box-like domain-containing protein [Trichoderma breve]